jgi:putative ABC transport system ATP-binding protein
MSKVQKNDLKVLSNIFFDIIKDDKHLLNLSIFYGFAISILSLSVPISVQSLVNTIANVGSLKAVFTLAMVLFFLLLIYGFLKAWQIYILEVFEQKFYARTSAEFTLKNIFANNLFYSNINRQELINRYFDITNIQKIIPSLIIGFFALILQVISGLILVSFYHPWIFLFNLLFVASLYFVWTFWLKDSITTSLELSKAKYDTARHLEEVARANGLFNSEKRSNFAVKKADGLIFKYLEKRGDHFKYTFRQNLAFLFLYALASASFLGIGGSLVIKGELTLGQLIAAELVLATVFYSISMLGYYLSDLYYICASIEEISHVYDIPTEDQKGMAPTPLQCEDIKFENTIYEIARKDIFINLSIKKSQKIAIEVSSQLYENVMHDGFKKYRLPKSGSLKIGGDNIIDMCPQKLRDYIIILDNTTVTETTIRQYLKIGNSQVKVSEIDEALKLVDLYDVVYALEENLDTELSIIGRPLTPSETLRLKIAFALIAKPKVLIINAFFDSISVKKRKNIFSQLCKIPDMTLIYFSGDHELPYFDEYIYLSDEGSRHFDNMEDFHKTCNSLK